MSDSSFDVAGDERGEIRLRHCPMDPGGLVPVEECLRCPHRPRDPFTVCAVSRGRPRARPRGFWDSQLD